ncbi:pyrroline-5-carboxylate reductase [Candidatus Desulfovibrio trichonymphae]|uniref:Pyrroline-5-carboxylate reductase n=1 Tax=Candidatus Desulfovibrio trichonymphae TaxID=1725232 RepID=A0A1J1DR34_9BACT|nr:pyrroline-5-carboxylate reductase [Candidatus Desulfovibrio trichonymphae]BAV92311.1 pyrroline-5-carboxylate reductase [Candidatus Desulfovibrio trichonymphae]GHU98156.1 pyrroline-5-carboxylate reductase [Deltaproteobacteria bacterium]
MNKVIGCVGCGNIGGAILTGLTAKLASSYSFCGFNRTLERMRPLEEKGVAVKTDALALARDTDIIILAVKPRQAAEVLKTMRPALTRDKILISVAAGVGVQRLKQDSGGQCPVVRCMPNTPALIGAGIFALCLEDAGLSPGIKEEVLAVFSALGLCVTLPETSFTAFSALIGAGPAYVFQMMQGFVQAGVTLGFAHREARELVTAMFAGSARLAAQRPAPLMQLRDEVCSPGGLTIAGVNHLDRAGLVGVIVDAVLAADARGREMEQ